MKTPEGEPRIIPVLVKKGESPFMVLDDKENKFFLGLAEASQCPNIGVSDVPIQDKDDLTAGLLRSKYRNMFWRSWHTPYKKSVYLQIQEESSGAEPTLLPIIAAKFFEEETEGQKRQILRVYVLTERPYF